MDFPSAKKLGACLARDYAEDLFRLLVIYSDISASEAASRLGLHIRTVQDFLENLFSVGVLKREEVYERKRPYFRYSLLKQKVSFEIDFDSLFAEDPSDGRLDRPVRERKNSGAQFSTARTGKHIATVTTWSGRARNRKERKINLTTPQGKFLYHLPFPTAAPMAVSEIMKKAGVDEQHNGEIADLLDVLAEAGIIEST